MLNSSSHKIWRTNGLMQPSFGEA